MNRRGFIRSIAGIATGVVLGPYIPTIERVMQKPLVDEMQLFQKALGEAYIEQMWAIMNERDPVYNLLERQWKNGR